MKTKFLLLLVGYFMATNVFSQSNLNNYKYIIIPKKYSFLKDDDQFKLNSLTKFLYNKYGFEAFMEGETYPDDLNSDRCLALTSDLIKDSSIFKTKLQIQLKNCNGLSIYTTQVGENREKDYNKAYNQALRSAFKELETINYQYVPVNTKSQLVVKEVTDQTEVVNEIAQLRAEIENLKQDKINQAVTTETPEASVTSIESSKVISTNNKGAEVLYAQAIENGFQLVDSTPKVAYKIKNTSMENVFMVEGKNATLYKKGDNWIMEYYENDVLKQDVLNIKF